MCKQRDMHVMKKCHALLKKHDTVKACDVFSYYLQNLLQYITLWNVFFVYLSHNFTGFFIPSRNDKKTSRRKNQIYEYLIQANHVKRWRNLRISINTTKFKTMNQPVVIQCGRKLRLWAGLPEQEKTKTMVQLRGKRRVESQELLEFQRKRFLLS